MPAKILTLSLINSLLPPFLWKGYCFTPSEVTKMVLTECNVQACSLWNTPTCSKFLNISFHKTRNTMCHYIVKCFSGSLAQYTNLVINNTLLFNFATDQGIDFATTNELPTMQTFEFEKAPSCLIYLGTFIALVQVRLDKEFKGRKHKNSGPLRKQTQQSLFRSNFLKILDCKTQAFDQLVKQNK